MEEGLGPGAPPALSRDGLGLSGPEPGSAGRAVAVRDDLLAWGARNRRDLPWRRTRDPWRVMVSEVMLQQTQVQRVLEPYERFVRRFPTPRRCADAGPGEVVRAWAGLGYNRRALNLYRAAEVIVAEHGGRVPGDHADLLPLPGVGEYTARAILSLAFGHDTGVVDTNAARVVARLVAGRAIGSRREAQSLADALVPPGRSWELNQSVFDLGATVCTRRRPRCASCTLSRRCAWAEQGWPEPDPAEGTAGASRGQPAFAGSDRQGRGRLVDALRTGPVAPRDVALITGWHGEPERVRRMVEGLIAEKMVRRGPGGRLQLA